MVSGLAGVACTAQPAQWPYHIEASTTRATAPGDPQHLTTIRCHRASKVRHAGVEEHCHTSSWLLMLHQVHLHALAPSAQQHNKGCQQQQTQGLQGDGAFSTRIHPSGLGAALPTWHSSKRWLRAVIRQLSPRRAAAQEELRIVMVCRPRLARGSCRGICGCAGEVRPLQLQAQR